MLLWASCHHSVARHVLYLTMSIWTSSCKQVIALSRCAHFSHREASYFPFKESLALLQHPPILVAFFFCRSLSHHLSSFLLYSIHQFQLCETSFQLVSPFAYFESPNLFCSLFKFLLFVLPSFSNFANTAKLSISKIKEEKNASPATAYLAVLKYQDHDDCNPIPI